MKNLKKDIQSVLKTLRSLTDKAEKISNELEAIDKPAEPRAPKARAKAAKKPAAKKGKDTSKTDAVLSAIEKSKKGADTTTISKSTGIQENNVRAILSRLRKQGKIVNIRRGIYQKA
jgi:predicted Rossmann fold nucleotide-binding protein DprA/Smf involved in DNA uptake